jgi:hypothetical protein
MTEPSDQLIKHATDQWLQRRVAAVLVQQTLAGHAAGPLPDPLPSVIEHRFQWASDWGTLSTITDGQIRDAVARVWPIVDVGVSDMED